MVIIKCPCGKQFKTFKCKLGRKKYCSKICLYKYRKRPSGLQYKIVSENKGWFKKGIVPKTSFKSEDVTGKKNCKWKGSLVGYDALHDWVKRHYGKAKKCEFCGSTRNVEWSNKSFSYKRDIEDWQQLCKKCHTRYDMENGWGIATKKFNLRKRVKK